LKAKPKPVFNFNPNEFFQVIAISECCRRCEEVSSQLKPFTSLQGDVSCGAGTVI
jgi:hypothetical protein